MLLPSYLRGSLFQSVSAGRLIEYQAVGCGDVRGSIQTGFQDSLHRRRVKARIVRSSRVNHHEFQAIAL